MTLNKFIKTLLKMQDSGLGSCEVLVDKKSLYDGNDTYVCCRIVGATHQFVPTVDGDGFQAYRKNGQECGGYKIVVTGESQPPEVCAPSAIAGGDRSY